MRHYYNEQNNLSWFYFMVSKLLHKMGLNIRGSLLNESYSILFHNALALVEMIRLLIRVSIYHVINVCGSKVHTRKCVCACRRRAFYNIRIEPALKRKRFELIRIFFDPVQGFILKIKNVFNSFHSLLVKIRRSSVRKTLDSHL